MVPARQSGLGLPQGGAPASAPRPRPAALAGVLRPPGGRSGTRRGGRGENEWTRRVFLSPLSGRAATDVSPSEDGSQVEFVFSRNKDKQVRNPLFEVAIAVPRQGEPTLGYVMPPGNRVRGQLVDGDLPISK